MRNARTSALLLTLGTLAAVPCAAADTLTQADLLRRVIDLDRLMSPPAEGEKTGMFSSYDRASKIDASGKQIDWDANGDAGQFIREEPDGWKVMAEMTGPGAITRVWSANPHGQIRFILDGKTAIDAPFENLFNGKLEPFSEPLCYENPAGGGRNSYFPIGYSRSCKVVLKDGAPYYQINYATFPASMDVKPFEPQLDDAAKAALADITKTMNEGPSEKQVLGSGKTYTVSEQADLAKGKTLTIETFKDPGCIRSLNVSLSDRRLPELYVLHRCILRIWFDGAPDPAVEVPLVDFFGSGFDFRSVATAAIGTEKWTTMPGVGLGEGRFMYCNFPMPFSSGAKVSIENQSDAKIGLMLYAQVSRIAPAADALRFQARFRKEDPCKTFDYPILETSGPGRIVGCVLNVDCPREAWWGEGDDKVWIDGEKFPSYFGTGSEDYLGDAWGLRPHTRPLQGVTRCGPYGKASAYRLHIADCIDFHDSVRFTIENWQHNHAKDTYYSTVAFWYGKPGASKLFKPLTSADLDVPGLRIPGSVEVEGHVQTEKGTQISKQKYADGAEYSGEEAVHIITTDPVKIVIPAPKERTVVLFVRVNPRRAFEPFELTDAGGRLIGRVQYARAPEGIYPVGLLHLKEGDNVVTVTCTKEAKLDCWILRDPPRRGPGPEGEDLKVLEAKGATTHVEYAMLPWSAGAQLAMQFDKSDGHVTLALPQAEKETSAMLRLFTTRDRDGGRFAVLLDNAVIGDLDTSAAAATQPAIDKAFGAAVRLTPGAHTLGFQPTGSGGAGRKLGLDRVDLAPTRSPFARECEELTRTSGGEADDVIQELGDGYSGRAQVWSRAKKPGAWVEFDVPVARPGRYNVSIVYTTSFDYGTVQTSINGRKAGEAFDTFGRLQPGPTRALGSFELPIGVSKVRCEVVGKNEGSPGYYFGIDCIILEPADRSPEPPAPPKKP